MASLPNNASLNNLSHNEHEETAGLNHSLEHTELAESIRRQKQLAVEVAVELDQHLQLIDETNVPYGQRRWRPSGYGETRESKIYTVVIVMLVLVFLILVLIAKRR